MLLLLLLCYLYYDRHRHHHLLTPFFKSGFLYFPDVLSYVSICVFMLLDVLGYILTN